MRCPECHITKASHAIIGVFCACVFVSVCPTWDIHNERSYHHIAWTILKSFAWRGTQTAFEAYTMHGLREKAFESFKPVNVANPVHARLHFQLPWAGWILPTTRKSFEHSGRVCIEGHALHIMGTIVTICFLREWARDISQYEKLITQ